MLEEDPLLENANDGGLKITFVQVPSLLGELRSCKLRGGGAKKEITRVGGYLG